MSARNQSEPPREGAGDRDVPVLQPDNRDQHSALEVVWSSPVSTGAGFGRALRGDEGNAVRVPEETTPEWDRCIYAFESDLLDSAFVHWNDENHELTLEMIPGFKEEYAPENPAVYPAETVSSGLGDLIPEDRDDIITRLDTADFNSALLGTNSRHFQPDISRGGAGPNQVRHDGIEDPITGWRPTGMVFFETLATPPRGTVYSSSLLDEFLNGTSMEPVAAAVKLNDASEPAPFFDFPELVAPAPPEDTEDFPLEVVVNGGRRSSGGGGVWIFKLMGRLLLVLLALIGLGALALAGSYVYYVKQRLNDGKKTGRFATVIVKPGDGFRTIIDRMHADGVLQGYMGLDDRFIMRYLAYAYENSDKLKPGVYRFDTGQNLNDVYDRLISGSKDFKITIPEGKTALEVAKLVGSQYTNFNVDRFMSLVNDPVFIQKLGIEAPSLEGYLYPSTYYFGPGMKEEELLNLMVGTFQSKVKTVLADKMTSDGLTFQEHVIMASLIEREARMDQDRPLIASVIFNRLRKGIPLQIDATVNYALNSWRRLNNSDYQTEHPYNTYKIKGLPPGPIASPRIESLLATYEAPNTDYLYYVHKGDGHHAFAETYAQHQANVGRYIREKNAPGMGNLPAEGGEGNLAEQVQVEEKSPALAGTITIEEPGESDNAEKDDKSDNSEKTDRTDEPDKDVKVEKADKSEASGKTDSKAKSTQETPKPKSY